MTDLSPIKVELLTDIFNILDSDQNGKISVKEFKRLGEAMYVLFTVFLVMLVGFLVWMFVWMSCMNADNVASI